MRRLRRAVKRAGIYRWLDSFLRAAVSRQLSDFPQVEGYVPAADPMTLGGHGPD